MPIRRSPDGVRHRRLSEMTPFYIVDELERAGLNEEGSDLDAIEALFRRLNMADEAAKARSMIMG